MANLRRSAWLAGAKTWLNGGNFSMNPYSPPPNATNAGAYYRNIAWREQNLAWTAGYWWAVKHRSYE